MILQKSFEYADSLLKKCFLLSVLKQVSIFVIYIHFFMFFNFLVNRKFVTFTVIFNQFHAFLINKSFNFSHIYIYILVDTAVIMVLSPFQCA